MLDLVMLIIIIEFIVIILMAIIIFRMSETLTEIKDLLKVQNK